MIISHKLQVIYIKLKKVAGTSFEVALSRYCGGDDILTPPEAKTSSNKKLIRLGYTGARNYQAFNIKKRIAHLGAKEIKPIIPAKVFADYLKIATIRSPYQKAISWYFWKKRGSHATTVGEDFESFVASECLHHKDNPLMDYDLIHINGQAMVDFVLRYEHLAEDIKKLEVKIGCRGLSDTFKGIHVKGQLRPTQGSSLGEVYAKHPKAKAMIDRMYYENYDKYELLRKYWPPYKSEVENISTEVS